MKGKLQKSWVLSSIVLLGLTTTLPSVNMVLAETVNENQNTEAQDVTMPYDNLLEEPTSDSSDTQQEPTVEEQPTFSLEKEQMIGTIGETTEVVILVDRPTNQVQFTIPQEITIQIEELIEGLEATQMTETEWWFSADERTEFTIPVSSETAGEFTIRVEDELDGTIAFEEAADDETSDESVITDETDSTNDSEDSIIQEVQEEEETPTQETEDITPATTSNVSTWAQFRTAINTTSVTEINVLADISGNTSLNNINRNLTINGNGFTINSQSQSYQVTGANRILSFRNAKLVSSRTGNSVVIGATTGASNVQYVLSDITFEGNNRFLDNRSQVLNIQSTVIFDGGTSRFITSNSEDNPVFVGVSVQLINDANVIVDGARFMSSFTAGSVAASNRLGLSIEKGSNLQIDFSDGNIPMYVQTLNIEGNLTIKGRNAHLLQSTITGNQTFRIFFGEESQVLLEQRSNAFSIINPGTNVNNIELIISEGAQFDLNNSGGGSILNNTRSNNVQFTTENLAVWNRGRTSSTPSQNFENIEVQLSGSNASTITNTNHNVFRSIYPKQGLNGYSRISSSGIAGESPVDPLEPDTEIDPDNPPVIPDNQGNFRLDFVSQFTFGSHERNMFEEETYYALPQYGLDSNGEVIENEPKPNFVQITDNRADADGWQLSVTQREQFKTETGNELSGASLQLKNRQLVADHDGQQPQEATTEETIILEPGAKQPLLTSSTGEGKGTWIYRFGDGTSSDQSVALVVPKETIPEATTYQTKLDWELQAVPGNE